MISCLDAISWSSCDSYGSTVLFTVGLLFNTRCFLNTSYLHAVSKLMIVSYR